jgi:hypothetical protein
MIFLNYANFGKKLRPLSSSQIFWLGPPDQVGVEPSGGGEGEPDRKPDVFRDAILNPYGHVPGVREHGVLGETRGGGPADGHPDVTKGPPIKSTKDRGLILNCQS